MNAGGSKAVRSADASRSRRDTLPWQGRSKASGTEQLPGNIQRVRMGRRAVPSSTRLRPFDRFRATAGRGSKFKVNGAEGKGPRPMRMVAVETSGPRQMNVTDRFRGRLTR